MTGLDLEEILEAAIEIEQQSYTTYTMAQKIVKNSSSKKFLEELAQEELKHKEKLLSIINDKKKIATLGSRAGKIQVDPCKPSRRTASAVSGPMQPEIPGFSPIARVTRVGRRG